MQVSVISLQDAADADVEDSIDHLLLRAERRWQRRPWSSVLEGL